MNRQQRRRMERRTARLDTETGIVATPLGSHFRLGPMVDMPEKIPGRHRWILSTAYVVSDSQAATAHEGVGQVLMGTDSLLSYGIGCWDCEQVYSEAVAEPCPGDPS